MPRYKNHEDFFKQVGEETLETVLHHNHSARFTVEEMYQFFKARYDAEKEKGKLDQFIEDRHRAQ